MPLPDAPWADWQHHQEWDMVGTRAQSFLFIYFAAAAVAIVYLHLPPCRFIAFAIGLLLAVLFVVTAVSVLSGRINTKGLLRDKAGGGFSGSRLQLLVVTVLGAAFYFPEIVHSMMADEELPTWVGWLLPAVGGSNGGYLAAKIYSQAFRGFQQTDAA